MESEKKAVKFCPICSNTEALFTQNPLSKESKLAPKLIPMGCLGKMCKFYNEQMNECIFVVQTVIISNMASKILGLEDKGE
ncbi:MAG: hypothetical protein K5622_07260 [Endomicrobiaceae bacterium]|nr:hypothetical protein [Endomicrobiaceae bacterium]